MLYLPVRRLGSPGPQLARSDSSRLGAASDPLAFEFDGHPVWGLTARVLETFRRRGYPGCEPPSAGGASARRR